MGFFSIASTLFLVTHLDVLPSFSTVASGAEMMTPPAPPPSPTHILLPTQEPSCPRSPENTVGYLLHPSFRPSSPHFPSSRCFEKGECLTHFRFPSETITAAKTSPGIKRPGLTSKVGQRSRPSHSEVIKACDFSQNLRACSDGGLLPEGRGGGMD